MSDFDLPEIALIGQALRQKQRGLEAQREGLSMQREIASHEKQRLDVEKRRLDAENNERQRQASNRRSIAETRRNLVALEREFNDRTHKFDITNDSVLVLATLQICLLSALDTSEELTDIKYANDLNAKVQTFMSDLTESKQLDKEPTQIVMDAMPILEDILGRVKQSIDAIRFLTFENEPLINISEVYKETQRYMQVIKNTNKDLRALGKQIPNIFIDSQTGIISHYVSLFVNTLQESVYLDQCEYVFEEDLYEALFLKGDTYNELTEKLAFFNGLIVEHNEQCMSLEKVDGLVHQGSVLSAKRLLDAMKVRFTDIPYGHYESSIENNSGLINDALALVDGVRNQNNLVSNMVRILSGKGSFLWEYRRIEKKALLGSPNTEIQNEVKNILCRVNVGKLSTIRTKVLFQIGFFITLIGVMLSLCYYIVNRIQDVTSPTVNIDNSQQSSTPSP